MALVFHLHERGVVRGRWGGAPHPASTNERARKSAQPSPARGEGPTRIAWGRGMLVRFRRCGPLRQPFRLPPPRAGEDLGYFAFANIRLRQGYGGQVGGRSLACFRKHGSEIMPGV